MENKETTIGAIKQVFEDKAFQNKWMQMHTPWIRTFRKVRRNEICPFCDSGKKYKNCECFVRAERNKYKLDTKHTKGWR